MRLAEIDLMDTSLFAERDPFAAFRLMRAEAPVYWHERKPGQGFWCITKYRDGLEVLRDPRRFSSAHGTTIDFAGRVTGFEGAMLVNDPPLHGQLRSLVAARFVRKSVENLIPTLGNIADRVLDQVIDRGECEFVYEISGQLPTAIICEMMKIPEKDRSFVQRVADDIIGATDPQVQKGRTVAQTATEARTRFRDYLSDLIDERMNTPGDELLSDFVHGKIGDRTTTRNEIIHNVLNFLIGGQETTRNTTAGALLLMIRHDEIREHFARNPASPTAIEEVLRYLSPSVHIKREATEDLQIRGQQIRKGDVVVVWQISANRDEEQFPNPEVFDPNRKPNAHLAFGFGEHVCIGQFLARLELNIFIEHILNRLTDFELAGPVQRLQSNLVYGVKKMPVRFKRK
jgi:cytochrome P450